MSLGVDFVFQINKKILISIIFIFLIFTIILIYFQLYNYSIITGSFTFVLIILLIIDSLRSKSPRIKYENSVKDILNTYDGILVEVKNIPDLKDKNILLVKNMEELIDAQAEIKKPIYFYKEASDCIFLLIDMDEVCIFIYRLNHSIKTAVDSIIELKEKKEIELL